VPANAVITILGVVSALLILFRIMDPPGLGTQGFISFDATVRFPIYLALLAAAGIALGGRLAMYEEARALRPHRPAPGATSPVEG
jgi:hypothetical protein